MRSSSTLKYRMRPTPSLCWWITGNPLSHPCSYATFSILDNALSLRLMVAFVFPCALKCSSISAISVRVMSVRSNDGLKYCNTRCATAALCSPLFARLQHSRTVCAYASLRVYAVRVMYVSAFIMVRALTASSRVSTVVVTRFAPLPTLTRYFEPRCVMPLFVRFINTPSHAHHATFCRSHIVTCV